MIRGDTAIRLTGVGDGWRNLPVHIIPPPWVPAGDIFTPGGGEPSACPDRAPNPFRPMTGIWLYRRRIRGGTDTPRIEGVTYIGDGSSADHGDRSGTD